MFHFVFAGIGIVHRIHVHEPVDVGALGLFLQDRIHHFRLDLRTERDRARLRLRLQPCFLGGLRRLEQLGLQQANHEPDPGAPAEAVAAQVFAGADDADVAVLVVLAEDMSISYGGRPYVLCSESEQWRANAVIAESISFLSGLKFVCLDRSDLLDTNGWLQLLKWMDTLAYERDIETAIVLATTDWEPSDLTDLMQSVRIEAGEIVRPEQREAA